MTPKVSFIVPCYKLAHLLPECINSILSQTYEDFEIIIMDDCSPDSTPEVAEAFKDSRIRHVRNDPNLGHLRNYNKGIGLAQGEYLWLISADDRLRKNHALEKYAQAMEAHPRVGYVFCNGISIENGQETGLVSWADNGRRDWIQEGRRFLCRLIHGNSVMAPSGMVRRDCYDKVSVFPLDLPYAGDWYLWCVFALHYDVAFLSEPLINYRLHGLSMTNQLTKRHRVADNLAVRWRVKKLAQESGFNSVVRHSLASLADHYAYCLAAHKLRFEDYSISFEEFEQSLKENASSMAEAQKLRGLAYVGAGDACYRRGQFELAAKYYGEGLRHQVWSPRTWLKQGLLRLGRVGVHLRRGLSRAV